MGRVEQPDTFQVGLKKRVPKCEVPTKLLSYLDLLRLCLDLGEVFKLESVFPIRMLVSLCPTPAQKDEVRAGLHLPLACSQTHP